MHLSIKHSQLVSLTTVTLAVNHSKGLNNPLGRESYTLPIYSYKSILVEYNLQVIIIIKKLLSYLIDFLGIIVYKGRVKRINF